MKLIDSNISTMIRDQIALRRRGARPVDSYQVVSQDVEQILRDAFSIKNATVRDQVTWVLVCGLENADDTNDFESDQAKGWHQAANENEYWHQMFRGSACSMSCEREVGTQARKWLARRQLAG